jgi:hypothetical protein
MAFTMGWVGCQALLNPKEEEEEEEEEWSDGR